MPRDSAYHAAPSAKKAKIKIMWAEKSEYMEIQGGESLTMIGGSGDMDTPSRFVGASDVEHMRRKALKISSLCVFGVCVFAHSVRLLQGLESSMLCVVDAFFRAKFRALTVNVWIGRPFFQKSAL